MTAQAVPALIAHRDAARSVGVAGDRDDAAGPRCPLRRPTAGRTVPAAVPGARGRTAAPPAVFARHRRPSPGRREAVRRLPTRNAAAPGARAMRCSWRGSRRGGSARRPRRFPAGRRRAAPGRTRRCTNRRPPTERPVRRRRALPLRRRPEPSWSPAARPGVPPVAAAAAECQPVDCEPARSPWRPVLPVRIVTLASPIVM